MTTISFSEDILEFFECLYKNGVHYVIVGGEAVIYYGYPRFTGDIDFYYEISEENIQKLFKALNDFWDNEIPGIDNEQELFQEGLIVQFGVPPNRIDIINNIDGVVFNEVWKNKTVEEINIHDSKVPIYYIGLKDLIANKRATNRNKDLDDIRFLDKKIKDTEL